MDTSSIPQKRCSKCGEIKPRTEEHFQKHKTTRDGFRPECKACTAAAKHAYYWADPEKRRKAKRDGYAKDPEKYRQRTRDFKKDNPEYSKEYNKKWKANHPEYDWRGYHREWERNNPDKTKKYNQDTRKKHPLIMRMRGRISMMKSKAKRLNKDIGDWRRADLLRMHEEQNGKCAYCGITISWNMPHDIHVDHIQPLSKGGSNELDNLALACADCNLSKGDNLLTDWMVKRGW